LRLAFKHFNESAYGGSSDGMFNLASMYLTGTGVEQSFQRAVLYFTQALDRGHTPAAYSLAVMHLNGIGTVRDCDIAVNLLKKVCERGEGVSSKLVDAYEYGEQQPDKAATAIATTSCRLWKRSLLWAVAVKRQSLILEDVSHLGIGQKCGALLN